MRRDPVACRCVADAHAGRPAGVARSRDDRPRRRAARDRRDRVHRHRRRPRSRSTTASTSSCTSRRRGARPDGRLRPEDAHEVGAARRDRDARRSTSPTAQAQVLEYVRRHVPAPAVAPLCGNSIGVDRRFLDQYMPELDHYLHYRSIDVSSLKELCRRWYPDVYSKRPGKAEHHRALDDIRESIAELRFYREQLLRSDANRAPRLRAVARCEERRGSAIDRLLAGASGPSARCASPCPRTRRARRRPRCRSG